MPDLNYREYTLVMRSKTLFTTDTTVIRVWPGQAVEDVAERVAASYGAEVVSFSELE